MILNLLVRFVFVLMMGLFAYTGKLYAQQSAKQQIQALRSDNRPVTFSNEPGTIIFKKSEQNLGDTRSFDIAINAVLQSSEI